jgi:hypothetical protein
MIRLILLFPTSQSNAASENRLDGLGDAVRQRLRDRLLRRAGADVPEREEGAVGRRPPLGPGVQRARRRVGNDRPLLLGRDAAVDELQL